MRHANLSAQIPCPIARTLEVVGEWWTLLVVRDALLGARRFDEFRATGISDNILTARLKKLVGAGILKKQPYQPNPVRYEYVLTPKALSPERNRGRGRFLRLCEGDDFVVFAMVRPEALAVEG